MPLTASVARAAYVLATGARPRTPGAHSSDARAPKRNGEAWAHTGSTCMWSAHGCMHPLHSSGAPASCGMAAWGMDGGGMHAPLICVHAAMVASGGPVQDACMLPTAAAGIHMHPSGAGGDPVHARQGAAARRKTGSRPPSTTPRTTRHSARCAWASPPRPPPTPGAQPPHSRSWQRALWPRWCPHLVRPAGLHHGVCAAAVPWVVALWVVALLVLLGGGEGAVLPVVRGGHRVCSHGGARGTTASSRCGLTLCTVCAPCACTMCRHACGAGGV
jgi:hypothetical protein